MTLEEVLRKTRPVASRQFRAAQKLNALNWRNRAVKLKITRSAMPRNKRVYSTPVKRRII